MWREGDLPFEKTEMIFFKALAIAILIERSEDHTGCLVLFNSISKSSNIIS